MFASVSTPLTRNFLNAEESRFCKSSNISRQNPTLHKAVRNPRL
jgi:hypothetical protein